MQKIKWVPFNVICLFIFVHWKKKAPIPVTQFPTHLRTLNKSLHTLRLRTRDNYWWRQISLCSLHLSAKTTYHSREGHSWTKKKFFGMAFAVSSQVAANAIFENTDWAEGGGPGRVKGVQVWWWGLVWLRWEVFPWRWRHVCGSMRSPVPAVQPKNWRRTKTANFVLR